MKISLILLVCFVFVSCNKGNRQFAIISDHFIVDTIPFASPPNSNIILLKVVVQEKDYKFIFDSGTAHTIVNSSIPGKKVSSDSVYIYNILYQRHPSVQIAVDTLQISKIKVAHMDSYLQRDLNLDGILGEDIIGKFVWKFDLKNRNIYVSKNILNFSEKDEGIPFSKKGQFITIECSINDVLTSLIIDTGYGGFVTLGKNSLGSDFSSGGETIFWEGFSTSQINNPYNSTSLSPHIDSTYYFTGDLNLGGILLEDEIFELRNSDLNIIGMDFFKRFETFIIDYPNQQIFLGKRLDKSLDFLFSSLIHLNTKGITLLPTNYKPQIGRVNLSAKNMGISYLDTILSIDNVSLVARDSSFFKSNSKLNEFTNTYEYKPSPFLSLYNNFHFLSDTSIVEIKRGNNSQVYMLTREYPFKNMPDSLYDYYMDLSLPLPEINRFQTESGNYYFKFKTLDLLPPNFPIQ